MRERHRQSLLATLIALSCVCPWSAYGDGPPRLSFEGSLHAREMAVGAALERADMALLGEDHEGANRAIEEAIAVDPKRAATFFRVGWILLQREQPWRARTFMKRYVVLTRERSGERWEKAHVVLGEVAYEVVMRMIDRRHARYLMEEAERDLLVAYESAYARQDLTVLGEIERLLGDVCMALGDHAGALRYLRAERSHSPSPDVFGSMRQEARLLIAMGRAEEALDIVERLPTEQLFDRGGRMDFEVLKNNELLVNCYRALGEYDLALKLLDWLEAVFREEVLPVLGQTATEPLLQLVYGLKATTHFSARSYDQAVRYQRLLLEMRPDDATRKNNLAWTMAVAAAWEPEALSEALLLSEEAVRSEPNAAHLDTLAEIYLRLGRYPDALEAIERALASHPSEPYLLEQRTRIQEARRGFAQPEMGSIMRFEPWEPPSSELTL